MKVIYIAGPFRSSTAWGVAKNVYAAELQAVEVWKHGAAALCPHSLGRHFSAEAPEEVFLEGMLELLRRCDAVLVLPGAERSSGTRAEIAEAERLGIPIFCSVGQVVDWLAAHEAVERG